MTKTTISLQEYYDTLANDIIHRKLHMAIKKAKRINRRAARRVRRRQLEQNRRDRMKLEGIISRHFI